MGKFEVGNKIGHRFTSTDQPKKNGRKPKLKSIPVDAQDKVYAALYHVLTISDVKEAKAYMEKLAEDLPECGYLIQVYAKGLMGKNAIVYASDIMDRLFGKARQVNEIGFTKEVPVLITTEEAEALGKWAGKDGQEE